VESKPIRIDAHQHFWDLSRSAFDYDWITVPVIAAINKNYLPENFVDHLASASMQDGVLVQTQHALAACSVQNGPSANSLRAILMSSPLYKKSFAAYQQRTKIKFLEKLL